MELPVIPARKDSVKAHKLRGTPSEVVEGRRLDRYIPWGAIQPPIRQSNLATWMTCPRKYALLHRFRLVRKGVHFSRALNTGSLWHLLMAHRYKGLSEEEALNACKLLVNEIVEEWQEYEAEGLIQTLNIEELTAQMEQDLAMARVMERIYNSIYPIPEGWSPYAVELRCTAKLKNLPTPIEGTIDSLMKDPEGNYWIIEHKTEGESVKDRLSTCSFEWQPRVYALLAEAAVQKRPIGVIHNIIKKPTIMMCGKDRDFEMVKRTLTRTSSKGEKGDVIEEKEYVGLPTFENYLARCSEWYHEQIEEHRRDPENSDPPLGRSEVRFDEEGWDELALVLNEASRASKCVPDLERFYRRARPACHSYGRPCPYLPLCESSPLTWRSLIERDYERREDDE